MDKNRSRLARLAIACIVTVGIVVTAAPALADGSTWAG